MKTMDNELVRLLSEKTTENEDAALVIVTGAEGSCPCGKGSMMLVDKNGNVLGGTIGGGSLEGRAAQDAVACLKKGESEVFRYNLDMDTGESDDEPDMICGGGVEVFITLFGSKDLLLIAGGGHIGLSLCRLGKMLGYRVVVVDDREEYVSGERFFEADELLAGDIAEIVGSYKINDSTSVVIVTRSHQYDTQVLAKVINTPARYIGMIGSKKKIESCFSELKQYGVEQDKLTRVHAPIGLDLGGDKPEEIALAIMAEIQAVKYKRGDVKTATNPDKKTVVVRGGGDVATGIIVRLHQAGFKVIVLETAQPTAIRRTVACAECLFSGEVEVEGVRVRPVSSAEEALRMLKKGFIPVLIDPEGKCIKEILPFIVVDAIMAKRNIGTNLGMAPLVIGVGPGFTAGSDVHAVVETKRGHYLGRVYYEGSALPDTGVPGEIAGVSKKRVIHSPADGVFIPEKEIGDEVEAEDILGYVGNVAVKTTLKGVLRGLIQKEAKVYRGMKIGDVDPRCIKEHCRTVSDKARAVGGGVLEAILHLGETDQEGRGEGFS